MSAWGLFGIALALLFLGDGLRMRRRLRSLVVLPSAEQAAAPFAVLRGRGVVLDAATLRAASAHADANRLEVLDLVPGRWNLDALGFAQMVDPPTFRRTPLAPGYSAGQALLVRGPLLERAGLVAAEELSPSEMLRAARRLKRYAPRTFDVALAPALRAGPRASAVERYALVRELFADFAPTLVAGQLALMALAWAAAVEALRTHSWLGVAGIAALQLQPALVLVGAPLRARGLLRTTLLGAIIQPLGILLGALGSRPDPRRVAAVEALRVAYRAAPPFEELFEPRRTQCYVCHSDQLRVLRRQPDLIQHKPGRFTLERCRSCGHLFQNPQLAPAGLSYYYRDFYDGLGEDWLESVFGLSGDSYLGRAREYAGTPPRRWLDVGGGYGHFSLLARDVWSSTRFECLDVGESALEAVKRGWADACHRGFLPELADSLAGQFDAVSLSHCLEHTKDPRAELAAARKVLAPGGTLILEVPDPAHLLRPVLRRYWLPYFQPQHLHLLSAENLGRLVSETGFTIERIVRGPAHVGAQLVAASMLLLDELAPRSDFPWLPPRSWARPWRGLVWFCAAPLFLAAFVGDAVLAKLTGLPRFSDAYRVVARVK